MTTNEMGRATGPGCINASHGVRYLESAVSAWLATRMVTITPSEVTQ